MWETYNMHGFLLKESSCILAATKPWRLTNCELLQLFGKVILADLVDLRNVENCQTSAGDWWLSHSKGVSLFVPCILVTVEGALCCLGGEM